MEANRAHYHKPKISVKKLNMDLMFLYPLEDERIFLAQCPPPPTCEYCTGCFLPGTQISTPFGTSAIESLKEGDLVNSYNFSARKIIPGKINKNIFAYEDIYLVINHDIKVTPFHRFWTNGGKWVRAKDLKKGDNLFGCKGDLVKIDNIRSVLKKSPVYNLSIAGVHKYYFAQGVLVHNKNCY